MKNVFIILVCLFFLAACSHKAELAKDGLDANFKVKEVNKYAENIPQIMANFHKIVGSDKQQCNDNDCKITTFDKVQGLAIYTAGANYVEDQCSSYLEALETYRRRSERNRSILNSVGALSGVVLGTTSAGQIPIVLTAAGFGFSNEVFDAVTSAVLLGLEPSGIRSIVYSQFSEHNDLVKKKEDELTNDAIVYNYIKRHLAICLPTSIRSVVNASVSTAKIDNNGNNVTVNDRILN